MTRNAVVDWDAERDSPWSWSLVFVRSMGKVDDSATAAAMEERRIFVRAGSRSVGAWPADSIDIPSDGPAR